MNSDLDRLHTPFDDPRHDSLDGHCYEGCSTCDFEEWLDGYYVAAEAEYIEREMGKLEMAQQEAEALGDF